MGRRAGRNAARRLEGKRPKPFEAEEDSRLLTFGDLDGFLLDGSDLVETGGVEGIGRELVLQAEMARLEGRKSRKSPVADLQRLVDATLNSGLGRLPFDPRRMWRL